MINVFDSFAGAGGFSLGFSQAGFNIVGANEIDDWACQTFQKNHPRSIVIQGDVTKISDKELVSKITQEVDVLLGGPPCQGFSISNSKKQCDPKDQRNSLFKEFSRLVKLFSPKVVIMENVPNIIRARIESGELVVDIIDKELQKLGYFTENKILEAINYGVPQIRKRFVIIGTRKKMAQAFPEAEYGEGNNLFSLKRVPTLWEAISDLPSLNACEESHEYQKQPQNEYQKQMRRNASATLYNHSAMRHSKRLVERFESMSWGQKGDELTDKHLPLKRNGNGQKSTNGYSQNNRRMFPDKPCHTITASFYASFVHPYDNRNLTPREGARIQSFPDDYIFCGKPTTPSTSLLKREGRLSDIHLGQYNQIGNAVPPLMSKAIASHLMKNYFNKKGQNVCS
jgi:DNA (cytosine-5)-methyltransferase 1